ncbi:hypothetical protein [Chitinilyticum piscinae]|uniref:Uncharacterized protein n=1 Tax=Chitinilyticum piscinae TaxID=2866724 RepID=A0A8J7G2Y3_9NEIS|nr:hypothetical protein [Chitinilyticum piscinae]MBE9610388.1 hypothetical protein [Chitinilyticum piscinae]
MRPTPPLLLLAALLSGSAYAIYAEHSPAVRAPDTGTITADWRAPAPVCWQDQSPQSCLQASEKYLRTQQEHRASLKLAEQ